MSVLPAEAVRFDSGVAVVVVGAGACGLTAALAARDAGAEVLLLERDAAPSGSTALSSGFIPAAATRFQRGIADSAAGFAADIQAKAKGAADPGLVRLMTEASGPALEWLADRHGLEFVLLDGFLYPGHRVQRMHAVPEKTGAALHGRLLAAAVGAGAELMTSAQVTGLYADRDARIRGVRVRRPDGREERIGCGALVLACNGFGGNAAMVRRHIPEMAEALYFGHPGNRGEALVWGEALGAELRHLGAYQGHGSVAVPHGILITWAIMMAGGVQVNLAGRRFSDERQGYSEQAVAVLAQPEGLAWNLYDARLHELALDFEDYRQAVAAGAVRAAPGLAGLAEVTGLPRAALADSLAASALAPPYHAVKVTGALFHTQGGLAVDGGARVRRADGRALPNLFAGGGAACGVSGPAVRGYLSGNGLLSAVTLGRLAGAAAAQAPRRL